MKDFSPVVTRLRSSNEENDVSLLSFRHRFTTPTTTAGVLGWLHTYLRPRNGCFYERTNGCISRWQRLNYVDVLFQNLDETLPIENLLKTTTKKKQENTRSEERTKVRIETIITTLEESYSPRICPKALMIKGRKNKSGIHDLCHCNHITYLHTNIHIQPY